MELSLYLFKIAVSQLFGELVVTEGKIANTSFYNVAANASGQREARYP
jgi:hypothetical protein